MAKVLTDRSVAKMSQEQLLLQCVREYAEPYNYEPYEKDLGHGRNVEKLPSIATGKGCHARRTLEFYEKRNRQPQPLKPVERAIVALNKTIETLINSPDFECLDPAVQEELISTYARGKKWS